MKALTDLNYLIVDDDPRSLLILTELLTKVIGCNKVITFEDSHNFESKLTTLPIDPDIIFLDILIKPLNGYEMLEIVRKTKLGKQANIISTTARVMTTEIQQMKIAGFDGMISKPIIFDVFPELIRRVWIGESVWYVA